MKKYYAVGAAVGVIALVGVAYLLGARNAGQEREWPAQDSGEVEGDEAAVPAGWTTYRSDAFGFSISYPTEGYQAAETLNPANDGYALFSFSAYPTPPAKEFGFILGVRDFGPVPEGRLEDYVAQTFGVQLASVGRAVIGDDEWVRLEITGGEVLPDGKSTYYFAPNGGRLIQLSLTGIFGSEANRRDLEESLKTVDIFSPSGREALAATYEHSSSVGAASVAPGDLLPFSIETSSSRFNRFKVTLRCPDGVSARLSGPWESGRDLCDSGITFSEPKATGEIVFEGEPAWDEVEISVSLLSAEGVRLGSNSWQYMNLALQKEAGALAGLCGAWGVTFSCDPSWAVDQSRDDVTVITNVGPDGGDTITLRMVKGYSFTDRDAKFGDVTYTYDAEAEAWPWRESGFTDRVGEVLEAPASEAFWTAFVPGGISSPVFRGIGRWLTYIVAVAPRDPNVPPTFIVANITGSGYTEVLEKLVRSMVIHY